METPPKSPKTPTGSPSSERGSDAWELDTLYGYSLCGTEPDSSSEEEQSPDAAAKDSSEAVPPSRPSGAQATEAGTAREEIPYRLTLPPLTPKRPQPEPDSDSVESSPYTPTPKPRRPPVISPGSLTLGCHNARSPPVNNLTPEQYEHYARLFGPQAARHLSAQSLALLEMSKSKEGQAETYHQEYIASTRYRNDLPPPEMPPKLLEIPHEGLERLLTPGYTSNMARREEPNIDVDAEGGMPIDLVGLPGLHLGDESAIMAPENPPPIDPADLPLLMTLDQLRNPAPKDTNVSFLRRNLLGGPGGRAPVNPNVPPTKVQPRQKSTPKISRDDPMYIKKHIQKGFDIANPKSKHTGEDTVSRIKGHTATKAELDAWANPVHPDNPNLKPVGFYPVLPDLQGFADPGGYVQFKFDKRPVQGDAGKRDERMDVSILVPSAPDEKICQDHATKVALHKTNPQRYPDPGPVPFDYDLFLPEKKENTKNVIASLDQANPNRDDPSLYTHEDPDGTKFHRYDRVRTYATSAQTLSTDDKQRDLALSIYDPAEVKGKEGVQPRQQAAYYYPILGKTRLTQDRARNIAKAGLAPGQAKAKEDQVDQIQMVVRDPDEAESYKRALHRLAIDPKFASSMPPEPKDHGNPEESPEGEGAHGYDKPSADNQAAGHNADEDDKMSDD